MTKQVSPEEKKRKRRLERGAILVVALGLILLTLVQREVLDLGPGLSDSQGVITLVSINFAVIMMALLLILILRHLYRIFFEEQSYGSLQTKMLVAFISLSLAPTILIFYYSYRLILNGHDLWFSPKIEKTLTEALELSEASLFHDNRLLGTFGADILSELQESNLDLSAQTSKVKKFLENKRKEYHLSALEYYDLVGQRKYAVGDSSLEPLGQDWFAAQLARNPPWLFVHEYPQGDLTRLVWPLWNIGNNSRSAIVGYFVLSRLSLYPIRSQIESVRLGIAEYREALAVQKPFRVTQLTALAGVALLATFISVWIGSHLSGSLLRPVLELVEGTKRVAAGDLDFFLSQNRPSSELATLVTSFNLMTKELKGSYAELDRRRRFVEAVLRNVSSGVMVISPAGEISVINQAAVDILGLEANINSSWSLPESMQQLLAEAQDLLKTRRAIERRLKLTIGDIHHSLLVHGVRLKGEEGRSLGILLAFDDLTELERAQRLATWREVARRIAHEVKNPLTPIQLAAQRLKRRFGERLANEPDHEIFAECTEVIIRQVEEMKNLVDEFSNFARLPEIKRVPGNIVQLVEESLTLFREAHKDIDFQLIVKNKIPIFDFDPEQMRRVLTNIFDNAIAALDKQGQVTVSLELDELAGLRLVIQDNGPGINAEMEERIFEPYVSTKDGGTGLGLSIVRTIISDHNGFIKLKNSPNGATFIIELPVA